MNISANNAINQAEKIITDIFENGTHDEDTGEGLYKAMTLIADARSAMSDINGLFFDAVISAKKLEELAHIYIEFYFTDKDNSNPKCYMADVLHDYAHIISNGLKVIESKLN